VLILLWLPNLRLNKADFERCLLYVPALCIRSILKLSWLRRRRLDGQWRLKRKLLRGRLLRGRLLRGRL